jgi:hypothetical protein
MTKTLQHRPAHILSGVRTNQAFTGMSDHQFACIQFPQTDPARLLPDDIW